MFNIKFKISYNRPRGKMQYVILENGEVWKLLGECNRCGKCCEMIPAKHLPLLKSDCSDKCKFLFYETLDGEKKAGCQTLWNRPFDCIVYPFNPYETLYEECSYSWKKCHIRTLINKFLKKLGVNYG